GLTIVGSAGAQAVTDGAPVVAETVQGTLTNGVVRANDADAAEPTEGRAEACDPETDGSSTDKDGGLVSTVFGTVESATEITDGGILDESSSAQGEDADQGTDDACATGQVSASDPQESSSGDADGQNKKEVTAASSEAAENDESTHREAPKATTVSVEVTEPEQGKEEATAPSEPSGDVTGTDDESASQD